MVCAGADGDGRRDGRGTPQQLQRQWVESSTDRQRSAFTRRSPLWANTDSAARIETQTSPRAISAARAARYDPYPAATTFIGAT